MIGGLFKSASRLAIVASAGILAGSLSAQAADLGGNCCADLEERVAELEATTARKGNRKVSLTVYGQVNKAVMWHDSDQDDAYRSDKLTVYDNQAATTRFGFRGSAKIRPDLEAGYQIEIGLNENKGTSSNDTNAAFNIRHSYFYLDDTRMGRLSIGQTSQTTDGLYQINLGNTPLTQLGTDQDGYLGSAYETTFNDAFDGARRQGIYYRTPTVAGFILGAGYSHQTRSYAADAVEHNDPSEFSTDSTDFWEVALRYAGEFNGIRVAAGIGYRNEDASSYENDVWLGSASVMHVPTGLFVSGGYGDIDSSDADRDQKGYWAIAGIQKNYFGPGNTTFYGEYGESDFREDARSSGDYWGLGIVQTIDAAAMDLYVQYRDYKLDESEEVDSTSASVIKGGAIIRF